MDREKDLDEILESIKERRGQIEKNIEPVLPPKEYDNKNDDLLWIDSNDIKNKINAPEPIEPPKIYSNDSDESSNQEESQTKESEKPKKAKKAKRQKAEERVKSKTKKSLGFNGILAIIICVLVLFAVVAGSIAYCYKNELYIFEKGTLSYSYESDILSEYKDKYANNNSFNGEINIDSIVQNGTVFNAKNSENAYFYNGIDISNKQKMMSIDMSHYGKSLEDLYATREAYMNSSQQVNLNTLFEKKTYKVIGAYYTNKLPDDNLGYVFPYTINGTLTKQSFADYRDGLKARMLYNTGYDISYDDEILSLCSDSDTLMPNYKFVVICIRMDKIEHTDITASSPNAIYYPQSYYDANDSVNPYKFAMGLNWKPILTFDDKEENTKVLKQQEYIEN